MPITIDRIVEQKIRPAIYIVNFIIIIKLCLSIYHESTILAVIFRSKSSYFDDRGEIVGSSIKIVSDILLLLFTIDFSININTVYEAIAAYVFLCLSTIFELQSYWSFMIAMIITLGLQSFIDQHNITITY